MNFSFFCKQCGGHLRKGDHRECKKLLKAAERTKAPKTSSESSQKFLAKLGDK